MTSILVEPVIGRQEESGRDDDDATAPRHCSHTPDESLQDKQGVPRILRADRERTSVLSDSYRRFASAPAWTIVACRARDSRLYLADKHDRYSACGGGQCVRVIA